MRVPTAAVLIVVGDQNPDTPLLEVPGSAGAAENWHNGPIGVKVGVIPAVIVMLTLVGPAH